MINLPAAFTERMKQMLGREYDAFIASYDKERSQGLRVNGLKTDPAEFAKTAPFSLNPVAWAAEGFAYGAEDRPGRHPYHDAGVYYIQEPSAMIAASLLNPQPGEMILDLCAAPGGKALHVAEKLRGTGSVEARDLSLYKVGLITENIERSGLTNIHAVQKDATVCDADVKDAADLVIADLPCSGLGVLAKKTDLKYKATEQSTKELAGLQREILKNAASYVRPGGTLIYSTCTINPAENIENVHWFLKEFPEFVLDPIADRLCSTLQNSVEEAGCLQLLPGIHKSDGFFIARFGKK